MADILIRGLSMPYDCDECKLCAFIPVGEYGLDRKCLPLNRNAEITIRRKDCPLVELPPHGDLIDASKLIPIYEEMKWSDDYCKECMKGAIWEVEQAPVIVPANKEESE